MKICPKCANAIYEGNERFHAACNLLAEKRKTQPVSVLSQMTTLDAISIGLSTRAQASVFRAQMRGMDLIERAGRKS